MKYSILITYYQGENIVTTALKLLCNSLKNRTDIEIIVCNDNPPVNISHFEKIDSLKRIKTIPADKNGGYSTACNRAAQIASGDILILMDSDIFVADNWLNGLEEVYCQFPNAGCISSTILDLNNGHVVHWGLALMGVEVLKPFRNWKLPEVLQNTVTEFSLVTSGCMMVSRHFYNIVGGMDPSFYNGYCDLDFAQKVREMGGINYATTKSIVYHRGKIAGQIRKMGEEDTRALFFSKWSSILHEDGTKCYENLLKITMTSSSPQYILLNFSKSLYIEKYKDIIQNVYQCSFLYIYDFKFLMQPVLLEDFLPWEMCTNITPFIYFCDNINDLLQNSHWFFHRNGRNDLLIDRNGNVINTDILHNNINI